MRAPRGDRKVSEENDEELLAPPNRVAALALEVTYQRGVAEKINVGTRNAEGMLTSALPLRRDRPGFGVCTLWAWTPVVANIVMAAFLSPLLIRRLGDEAYGLWALVFSLTEYYAMFDFGFRSAVVKYVAQHWALGEDGELNRTLNTAFLYLAATGCFLLLLTLVIAPLSPDFFVVSAGLHGTFAYMVFITGSSCAVSLLFLCFSSCLEAVQRFDLSNRILLATNVARVVAVLAMLQLGFGLTAVVTAAAAARLLQCVLLWRAFGRQFPQFRWSFAAVNRATFLKLFSFSIHTVPSTIGWLLLLQGPAVVIGHALPARFVGYYALPSRLIQSAVEFVYRGGLVTNARAAELVAYGERDALVRLAIQADRYGLVIFMPVVIFLAVYGDALFRVWLTPQYAASSAPLLPIVLVGVLLSDASHFNASSMLYGMAKHQLFSWALLVESVIALVFVYHFAQRGDLVSAATTSASLMAINRGLLTPWLLCRHLRYPVIRYITETVGRPLSLGVVATAMLWLCRETWLPGTTLLQLASAGIMGSILFLFMACRYCLLAEHRVRVLGLICQNAPFCEGPARRWFGVGQVPVRAQFLL
jgi:O-antigen/teichoic acid export membrane protein